MRSISSLAVVFLFSMQSFGQTGWVRRGPMPVSESLSGGAWNGSLGVLVGQRGTVLTSPDGVTWTLRARITHQLLRDVAWSGSLFVAVGDSGTVITSSDGVTWTPRATQVPYDLSAIACADGLCVVPADWGSAVLTSSDGVAWTTRTVANDPNTGLNSVVRVPAGTGRTARWVAVGSHAVVSEDGVAWTRYSTGVPSTLSDAVWNGVQVVANTGLGIATSATGVTWNDVRTVYPGPLLWTGSGYLAPYGSGIRAGTGTAPTAWTEQDLRRGSLKRILRMGAQYVAIGYDGHIETSTDASTWTPRSGPTSLRLSSIVWADSQFTAVGDLGIVLTSRDAVNWTPRASGTTFHLRRVIAAPAPGMTRRLVAVGDSGRIAVANDGTAWSAQIVPAANGKSLLGAAWTGTLFVAVGAEGTLLTSPDGSSWTKRTSGTMSHLYNVAFSGNLFVATGLDGTLLTSPDGISWTSRTSGVTSSLNAAVWSNARFTVFGGNGALLTSTDGMTWTQAPAAPNFHVSSLRWTGSRFIAVGSKDNAAGVDQTYVATSADGVTWAQGRLGADVAGSYKTLDDVAWNGSFFVAVGAGGLILTSPDGSTAVADARAMKQPDGFAARLEGIRLDVTRPASWRGFGVATLYAPSGRRVARAGFGASGTATFSVQRWPRGVYFIEVRGPEGSMVRPFSLTH
jgi:hypothetical protein